MRDTKQRPILVVAIVTAFCLLGDSMLYIVLPIFWRDAGLDSLWQVGILLSINRFVRLPLNPVIGWLYQKISLRTGLLAAVLIGSATTAGYGLLQGFAAWLVLRALWGVAWSFLRMGGFLTVIAYSDDASRGYWMGRFNGLSRIGSLFGMLGGGVLAPLFGLSAVALVCAAAALAGLFFCLFTLPAQKDVHRTAAPPPQASADAAHLGAKPWYNNADIRKTIATGLLLAMLQSIVPATLSLVVESNFSGELALFGFVLAGTALAGLLQAVRWTADPLLSSWIGRLSDGPKGRKPLFAAVLAGAGCGFALMPWSLPLPLWLGAVLLVMISGTALATLMDALASDAARHTSVVAVITTYTIATDLGSALGPAASYMLAGWTGGLAPVYCGSAALLALLALWHFPRKRGTAESVTFPGAN